MESCCFRRYCELLIIRLYRSLSVLVGNNRLQLRH